MIGILKFKLPEEQADFLRAQKASHYLCALWEVHEWLNRQLKGDLHPDIKNARAALQMCREILDGELASRGIDFEQELE